MAICYCTIEKRCPNHKRINAALNDDICAAISAVNKSRIDIKQAMLIKENKGE